MKTNQVEQNLILHNRAVIIAPAGCGKTETIVKAVSFCETGRQLILTHTNAGVYSLQARLIKKGVSPKKYKLQTIASFAIELVRAFPKTAGVLLPSDGFSYKYDDIYKGIAIILRSSFGKEIIKASFAGAFVDEYQDCTILQHQIILSIADIIPCRILGDPLQGIFDFSGNELVDWNEHVYKDFEKIGELADPWRWKETCPELGDWIMKTRTCLEKNEPLLLQNLPASVRLWSLKDETGNIQRMCCYTALKNEVGTTVALHTIPQQAHYIAKRLGGCYHSAEEVECKTLIKYSEQIECSNYVEKALLLIDFASECATKVNTELKTIKNKIKSDNFCFNRINKHKSIADALYHISQNGQYKDCLKFMQEIEKSSFKIVRLELWNELKRALKLCIENDNRELGKIAKQLRNDHSLFRQYHFKNIVSRILLVKGLEYNQVIILNADELSKKEFYVAISRPKNQLYIISRSNILNFK